MIVGIGLDPVLVIGGASALNTSLSTAATPTT